MIAKVGRVKFSPTALSSNAVEVSIAPVEANSLKLTNTISTYRLCDGEANDDVDDVIVSYYDEESVEPAADRIRSVARSWCRAGRSSTAVACGSSAQTTSASSTPQF
jgi:hypothetical protein